MTVYIYCIYSVEDMCNSAVIMYTAMNKDVLVVKVQWNESVYWLFQVLSLITTGNESCCCCVSIWSVFKVSLPLFLFFSLSLYLSLSVSLSQHLCIAK